MNPNEKALWEILVPTIVDGNHVNKDYHKTWDKKVHEISGGLTILNATKGQWVSPDNQLFVENMIPVRIFCSKTEIESIADFTAVYYNQKAIMFYLISQLVEIKHYQKMMPDINQQYQELLETEKQLQEVQIEYGEKRLRFSENQKLFFDNLIMKYEWEFFIDPMYAPHVYYFETYFEVENLQQIINLLPYEDLAYELKLRDNSLKLKPKAIRITEFLKHYKIKVMNLDDIRDNQIAIFMEEFSALFSSKQEAEDYVAKNQNATQNH